jgi:Domain of unknown function (DUF4385)
VPSCLPMTKITLKQPPERPLATPALDDLPLCMSYTIGRGETGVLSFEPYKSLILPYWAFKTPAVASNSAEILWLIFQSYCERGDFVGADMTRKFIQMGMTRSRRYANHKGGRKYGKDGKELERWTEEDATGQRAEKEEASRIFKEYWQRCIRDESYRQLKNAWSVQKRTVQEGRTPRLATSNAGPKTGDAGHG